MGLRYRLACATHRLADWIDPEHTAEVWADFERSNKEASEEGERFGLTRACAALGIMVSATDDPMQAIADHVELTRRVKAHKQERIDTLESVVGALNKRVTTAESDARKFEVNIKRNTPLVAELHVALRHVAVAVLGPQYVGADDVSDVPSVNQLRMAILAKLKVE